MAAGEIKVSLMSHLSTAPGDAKMYIVMPDGSYGYITKDEFLAGIGGGSSGLSFHANVAAFPATGNTSTLYIDKSSNQIYRWSGSTYVKQDRQSFQDVTDVNSTTTNEVSFSPDGIKGVGISPTGLITINTVGDIGKNTIIDASNITADRSQHLPDKDGTFAMTSDIPGSATAIDALNRSGSNADQNISLGSYNFGANEIEATNGFIGNNFQLVKVSDKVFYLIDNYGRIVAGFDGTTDYIYKYGNGALQYNESTDEFTWNGHAIATVDAIPDVSHLASKTYADNVSGTAESNAKAYADGLVAGLLDLRGNYNASGNAYPSTGGSGSGGSIKKGDFWYISVAGTLGGVAVGIGDSIYALVDSPGSASTNWAVLDANISYVAEDSANKTNTMAGNTASSTKFLSAKGVYDYLIGMTWLTDSIFGTWFSSNSSKSTPVDADSILIGDSADSNKSKKLSFTNLKSFLLSYFQGIFAPKYEYMVLTSAYVLANSTSLQKMFNIGSGSAGAFNTTANKTYKFRLEFDMTGLSASSGTLSFGFLGTAIVTSINYKAETCKQALATAAAPFIVSIQSTSINSITSSTTATTAKGFITGIIRCTTAGTLIPAIATSIGVTTAQVEANSYFEISEVGSNTITATSNIS
jgi:hypothetical protein